MTMKNRLFPLWERDFEENARKLQIDLLMLQKQ